MKQSPPAACRELAKPSLRYKTLTPARGLTHRSMHARSVRHRRQRRKPMVLSTEFQRRSYHSRRSHNGHGFFSGTGDGEPAGEVVGFADCEPPGFGCAAAGGGGEPVGGTDALGCGDAATLDEAAVG